MSGPDILGEKEGAPYGIDRDYDYPVAIIGDEPYWYFTPEDLRAIADEIEEEARDG